ncbi:MAG: DUF1684 domain-containing protein [Vicinamibacterales bacterium]
MSAAAVACTPQPPDYVSTIADQRAAKDEAFKEQPGNPVPPDKMAALVPLAYFPIDELYAVPATLEPAAERTRLQVPTSTGKIRDIERIGTLRFSVKGQKLSLTAFHELDQPQITRLFVPFADLTNGTETYSAGRYMELDPTPTGIYVVDFNVAYHPYCYYNEEYDCPYPPKENRLETPIRAGERLRKGESSIP